MANVTATTYSRLGGQFQIGNAATPEIFTTIAQVKEVDYGGQKVDVSPVTSADNTDGVIRKKDFLFDPGQVTITIFWNPLDPTHQQLENAFIARGTWDFKDIKPGGIGTRAFSGIIMSLEGKETIDKPTEKTCKIDISGPWTDTGGSE